MKYGISVLSFVATFLFTTANAVLAEEEHGKQALQHAQEAVKHGKMGHADVLNEHTQKALEHAGASQKAHTEAAAHMGEAITHLNKGAEHAKMGHADVATQHLEQAVTHIKAGNQ